MPVYLGSSAIESGEKKHECNPNIAEMVMETFLVSV